MFKLKAFWNLPLAKFGLMVCLAITTVIIIHSCKKDTSQNATITDPAVIQAKSWYEQTYQKSIVNGLRTLSTNTYADSVFHYNGVTAPDWNNAASYTRFNAAVLELPTDPKKPVIRTDVSNFPQAEPIYKNKYSRSSFLMIKDSTGYHGYIMTIIADSLYINNDLSKLNKNKYNNRDPNFSGILMYHTPDGTPVSAWIFKDGNATTYLYPHLATINNSSKALVKQVSATNTPSSKYVGSVLTCEDFYTTVCSAGGGCDTHYSYTVCTYGSGVAGTDDSNSSNGSTGNGQNGSGAGNGSTGTQSAPNNNNPCSVPAASKAIVNNQNSASSRAVSPGGSGFPSPSTTPPTTCPTAPTTTTTTTLVDRCAQKDKLTTLAKNPEISGELNSLELEATTSKYEAGFAQNLQTMSTTSNYVNTPELTANTTTPDQLQSTFSWDSTNGYTIGFAHDHPNGTGPSPEDVFAMLINSQSTKLTAAGAASVAFYKANASETVVTATNTYIVTVNDWAALQTIYNNYLTNKTAFDKGITDNTVKDKSYEAAFLTAFGDSINLYTDNQTPGTYRSITATVNTATNTPTTQTTQCPTKN